MQLFPFQPKAINLKYHINLIVNILIHFFINNLVIKLQHSQHVLLSFFILIICCFVHRIYHLITNFIILLLHDMINEYRINFLILFYYSDGRGYRVINLFLLPSQL